MKRWGVLSLVGLMSVVAQAGELKVSQLGVPAEKIGPEWNGPSGLVIDDLDAPPAAAKDISDIIAELQKQMKPHGVKGTADFTYHKKNDPMQMVTVRVFVFKTEEQCRKWIETKYQFSGWEQKYKKVEAKDYVGFDSLEAKKRIAVVGNVWITSGTIADNDDHVKILDLILERLKQQKAAAGS